MSDITLQAPDLSIDNPLHTTESEIPNDTTNNQVKAKKPKDPKIKLLIGLGVVIAVLLPLSLLVPNKNKPTINVVPTPTPLSVQTGPTTAVNPDQIPPHLQSQFDNVSKLINPPDLIPVPQIDDTTGKQ